MKKTKKFFILLALAIVLALPTISSAAQNILAGTYGRYHTMVWISSTTLFSRADNDITPDSVDRVASRNRTTSGMLYHNDTGRSWAESVTTPYSIGYGAVAETGYKPFERDYYSYNWRTTYE